MEGTASVGSSQSRSWYQYVLDAFALAGDVKELQAVWFKNQAAFDDPIIQDAYKARGKELSK